MFYRTKVLYVVLVGPDLQYFLDKTEKKINSLLPIPWKTESVILDDCLGHLRQTSTMTTIQ